MTDEGGGKGNPPCDIIKRGENGKDADRRVWGFHNQRALVMSLWHR